VIERILRHIGEDPTPPCALPARSSPQLEMDFAQTVGPVTWDEMDQTTEFPDAATQRVVPVEPVRDGCACLCKNMPAGIL